MKNAFYFTLKAFFVLQIFKFLSCPFSHAEKNSNITNARLFSKFMMSQPVQQTIAINILPKTSQTKDNQTIKFGQLVEYRKRNIFLQK